MKIIVIGSPSFKLKVKKELSNRFVKASYFTDPIPALQILRQESYADLVLIDEQSSKVSSLDIKDLIEKSTKTKQVLILKTGRDFKNTIHKLKLNIQAQTIDETGKIKGFIYKKETNHLYVKGEKIQLSPKQWELLSFLLSFQDRCVSKESVINKIWGHRFMCRPQTLTTHLNILRKKLKQFGVQIETVHSYGYKLISPD